LGLKLLLLLLLPTTTTVIYFVIQRNILFPTWQMPKTFIDRIIPFRPHWVWIYLSLYVLSPIGAILTRSRENLIRYTIGVAFYSVVGFVCFVLFPVAAPRPAMASGDPLYDHLILYDRVYNSVPSLHAACGIFAVLYLAHISRDSLPRQLRNVLLAAAWLWYGLILYSTIATRQHYFLDLPPGILLGWLTERLVLALPAPYLEALATRQHSSLHP
jgi:membrane-associated phospholipid phosphatase